MYMSPMTAVKPTEHNTADCQERRPRGLSSTMKKEEEILHLSMRLIRVKTD